MKKKKLYAVIALCGAALSVHAQELTLNSQVRSTDGQPVVGAIVSVVGTESSVITDESGAFTLTADDKNAMLSIKANGYYDKEVPVRRFTKNTERADRNMTITLTPSDEALYNGKVETSYASLSRQYKPTTVEGIENKDFSEKLSVGAALRDGVAGLQVIEKSGMPGEGTYMNVRGIHTFVAENSPLIVINGVPFLGNMDVSSVINGYSRDILFGYDPKDIRSVTVLKGADAAMYGSLGSNGVIMIETQQATSDNLETRISFSGQYGFNFSHNEIPVLNSTEYKNYIADIGMTLYPSMSALTTDYPFLLNSTSVHSYLFNENTDWMDEIQRTGFTTENLFRVEGGDEIAKYNISFGYTSNNGTMRNTGSDRYHTLISADVLASRKVDIFANIGLSYITSDLQNVGMESETNAILAAYLSMPLISPYAKQSDGSLLSDYAAYNAWNTSSIPTYDYDNTSNALAIVNTVEGTDKIYDANTNVGINFQWNEYLKLTAMVNLYYNYTEETMFIPGVTSEAIMPQVYGTGYNKVGNGVIRQSQNTYSLSAQYKRTFNDVHDFNAMAVARLITKDVEVDISEGYNTASDYYKTLDNTNAEQSSYGSNTEWNYLGYSLHADYTYNKLIKAYAGFALDGTSASGADASRWGFFPSIGATFMAANTGALPSWVDLLNITFEGSFSGNSRFSSNYGKNYYTSSTVFYLGAITRSSVPNTKLTWEKKKQLDLGIDVSLFAGKFDVGVNLFTSEAYDLLLNRDISAVYGSSEYYDNTGKITGKGVELSFRVNPIHNKDFDFVLSANMTTMKNTIKSLGGQEYSIIEYTGYNNDDAEIIMAVGESPYEFYGYKTDGVYSTTEEAEADGLVSASGEAYTAGDVKFIDISGPDGEPDGVINDYDKVSLGSTQPSVYGGINLMFRYKRFILDANFGYSIGNKLYNATRRQLESMSTFYNQSTAVLERWQVEGQETSIPKATYGDPVGNSDFSDRWIEDGDYLKLRSVKLSYAFDRLFSFIRSGTVYVAAENLFTITGYLGSDPEFAYSYDETLRGFDYAKVTLPITVKIGFDLNF